MSDVAAAKAFDKMVNTVNFMVRVSLGTVVAVAVARAMGVDI